MPRYSLQFSAAILFIASQALAQIQAKPSDAVEQATTLARQGNFDRALEVLDKAIRENPKNSAARLLLGQILQFDGQPDKAVATWEAGLTNELTDVPLLVAVGEVRLRQAQDGPTVAYRRGTISVQPNQNGAGEEIFKTERLANAVTAYEKARKLSPKDAEIAQSLASAYSQQKKSNAAIAVWNDLIKAEPKNGLYHQRLGEELNASGKAADAIAELEAAVSLNPRLASVYSTLAEIFKTKGEASKAAGLQKKADFYSALPGFSKLTYSDENMATLSKLHDASTLKQLLDDSSDRSIEFLATLCWQHPHDSNETKAFDALEARGARTTPILQDLLKGAGSTCTVRSTSRILARRKSPGMLDFLVARLGGDLRGFGMEMDIAGSLDELGDPGAVEHLAHVIAPDAPGAGERADLMQDYASARARAALALGRFNTPESIAALERGPKDPLLKPFCLAALYRISRSPKHLDSLDALFKDDPGYPGYLVSNYFVTMVGDERSKALAEKWRKLLEAKHAADEAASKAKTKP